MSILSIGAGTKKKTESAAPPSGLMMMLKAMGIEFDPKMFSTMAGAVEEIRARLQSIEEKVDALAKRDANLNPHKEKPNAVDR